MYPLLNTNNPVNEFVINFCGSRPSVPIFSFAMFYMGGHSRDGHPPTHRWATNSNSPSSNGRQLSPVPRSHDTHLLWLRQGGEEDGKHCHAPPTSDRISSEKKLYKSISSAVRHLAVASWDQGTEKREIMGKIELYSFLRIGIILLCTFATSSLHVISYVSLDLLVMLVKYGSEEHLLVIPWDGRRKIDDSGQGLFNVIPESTLRG